MYSYNKIIENVKWTFSGLLSGSHKSLKSEKGLVICYDEANPILYIENAQGEGKYIVLSCSSAESDSDIRSEYENVAAMLSKGIDLSEIVKILSQKYMVKEYAQKPEYVFSVNAGGYSFSSENYYTWTSASDKKRPQISVSLQKATGGKYIATFTSPNETLTKQIDDEILNRFDFNAVMVRLVKEWGKHCNERNFTKKDAKSV